MTYFYTNPRSIPLNADFADVELAELVGLFYQSPENLGEFETCSETAFPEHARRLLSHDHHMTVTVERFHDCLVDVQVLQTRMDGNRYSRKILLTRQTDDQVVMFGVVRLNLDELSPDVQEEIRSQRTPLGRILIEHDVMRKVKLLSLFEIKPGLDLKKHLDVDSSCYGRTALIYCDGRPAIELLEIVK